MVDLGIPGLGPGRVIGRGGSSTVFVATRSSFGNRIAVKLLKPTLSDEQSRKHFDRKIPANYSDQNLEAGFSIHDEGSPTLVSNDAANNALSGFIAADQSDPVLRANRSIDNDQGGFAWFDVAAGSATGNTARGNGTSGFTSQGSSTATWTANRSSANSVDGFTWFEQATGLAEGNIAADNSFDGFAAEDQTAPTLRRNSAFGNLRNQFFENGEASPQLFDNDFGS